MRLREKRVGTTSVSQLKELGWGYVHGDSRQKQLWVWRVWVVFVGCCPRKWVFVILFVILLFCLINKTRRHFYYFVWNIVLYEHSFKSLTCSKKFYFDVYKCPMKYRIIKMTRLKLSRWLIKIGLLDWKSYAQNTNRVATHSGSVMYSWTVHG